MYLFVLKQWFLKGQVWNSFFSPKFYSVHSSTQHYPKIEMIIIGLCVFLKL